MRLAPPRSISPFTSQCASTLLAIALAAGLGCATAPSPDVTALGPGVVFPTLEAAVYDALAHASSIDASARTRSRMRAGTIQRVEDGFVYGEVHLAPRHQPDRVRYGLKADDVAHFAVYPAVGRLREDATAEVHSQRDRANVDHRDPLHRPHYILTPSLRVVVYEGEGHSRELASLAQGLAGSMAMR